MKTFPDFRLRDMFEEYLTTQCQAVQVEVEGPRHCWLVKEERIELKAVYDWMGIKIKTVPNVITSVKFVWLGVNGAITVTKSLKFHRGGNVETSLPLEMKRWVWNEYFGITL